MSDAKQTASSSRFPGRGFDQSCHSRDSKCEVRGSSGVKELFARSVLTSVVLLAIAADASRGLAQSQLDFEAGGAIAEFAHPPLRYRGPDPIANQFFPTQAVAGSSQFLAPPDLPAAEFLPPQAFTSPGSIDSFLIPADGYQGPSAGYPGGSMVSDHKDGFFQKVSFTGTWIDRNDKFDDFGLTELDLMATFAAPLPTAEWPLLITPAMKTRILNGPGHVDLPAQLYESYLELLWLPRFHPRWTAILGVAGGVYSDFEVDGKDAWRMTGTGLMRFDWNPGTTQLIFGVLYLNRRDIRLLPAGGIIWTPDANRRYEVLFPRPKLAHRIAFGPDFEDWVYLGGEFGGNSYSVQRVSGNTDVVTLRDFRTYIGLERKLNGGAGYHLEIGYVMGRVIEFQSATPDVEADPTAMLRGGVTF